MEIGEFKTSIEQSAPPDLAAPLQGLWWAANGEWDRAHKVVQDEQSADAAWVHAYLHRVEGDLPNARYWYGQARRPAATNSLAEEWDAIVVALIGKSRIEVR